MDLNKLFKLSVHQKKGPDDELLINLKDLGQDVAEGDIIEIYHKDQDGKEPRLLMQIPKYDENFNGVSKDSISIEQNLSTSYKLRTYKDVTVNKVDPDAVSLELLELTFKDQYLSRSDMWRLKRSLINKVMHINKKIEYCSGTIRCQIYEMWTKGDKVSCGLVNEFTKVVFRSSTCQAYLFIQMSSEMWEFDMHGDLYYEKAIRGFLAELFTKWVNEGSNHDVTIVFFSRTYYKASHISEFPEHMRECLLEDYQGNFYEDFYRVVVQNERYDDWKPINNKLVSLCYDYEETVLKYHQTSPDVHIPEAYNSNAAQGNFLEVLNISLNVFEKHYQDRSFDRTGQMSVVITPGVGVFEVDRELTNITKQRIIDNGVGSDLVCMGEQPLHAVPLLKFHKKKGSYQSDDYSMPHTWINLSFYSSGKRLPHGTFIPRIKVPDEVLKSVEERKNKCPPLLALGEGGPGEHGLMNSVFDYDAYDAQVFKLPTNQNSRTNRSLQRTPSRKKATSQSSSQPPQRSFPHKLSDPDLYRSVESSINLIPGMTGSTGSSLGRSPAINIPTKMDEYKTFRALNIDTKKSESASRVAAELEDMSPSFKSKFGSSGANSPDEMAMGKNIRPGRSLINPFDPSHVTIKRTSNRRRWIHIFPKGPAGVLIQQHHYQVSSTNPSDDEDRSYLMSDENKLSSSGQRNRSSSSREEGQDMKEATLLWGATGEQEWNAEITTGVDWKSMTLPACLPLTTDYFPDKQSLNNDYVVAANYALVPDNFNELTKGKKAVTTYDVFLEFVSQRLAQGFQLIVKDSDVSSCGSEMIVHNLLMRQNTSKLIREYQLSIGRVFHRVQLSESPLGLGDSPMEVTVYRPRHPYAQLKRRYKYLFRSPYLTKYEISWAEFRTERLENYKWNYLDNYICSRGDPMEGTLLEELKYWRVRLLILPDIYRKEVKRLMEPPCQLYCDIFHSISLKEQQTTNESFLKLLEFIYKIKKTNSRKTRNPPGFRERLGSNRMTEKPRVRSSSKPIDRVRFESGNKEDTSRGSNDGEEDAKDECEERKLSLKRDLSEIVEVMKDPVDGIPFVSAVAAFPPLTFISADASYWLCKKVEEITSEEAAVEFMKKLFQENYFKHVCKRTKRTFNHGFFFYTFAVDSEINLDPMTFDSEWLEVLMNPLQKKPMDESICAPPSSSSPASFLMPQVPLEVDEWSKHYSSSLNFENDLFKLCYIDIDAANKSDRYEWGHLKYMTQHSPLEGFEIVLQWICATGPIVNELIVSWQRKALQWNLHLFPVPSDPFALPHSYNSNPLRGPIVIPLDVRCLRNDDGSEAFDSFTPESRETRMYLFQEAILERFGFFRYMSESLQYYFVHPTGNTFVMINSPSDSNSTKTKRKVWSTPKASLEQPRFMWTFNYMLSRRWKSAASGDEALGEKILRDFKYFCSNEKGRLQEFFSSSVAHDDAPAPASDNDSTPFVDVEMQ